MGRVQIQNFSEPTKPMRVWGLNHPPPPTNWPLQPLNLSPGDLLLLASEEETSKAGIKGIKKALKRALKRAFNKVKAALSTRKPGLVEDGKPPPKSLRSWQNRKGVRWDVDQFKAGNIQVVDLLALQP